MTVVFMQAERQAVKQEYEEFLKCLRYINLDDEPVLYCPKELNVVVERYVCITVMYFCAYVDLFCID